MKLPTPVVPFPEAQIGEWTVFGSTTAPGLFTYRHTQAIGLLELPDFGDGDLDSSQRREALRNAVLLQKPLTALALFLGIVALEDFVRDLSARLAETPSCLKHFPGLAVLRAKRRMRQPAQMYKRLDKDPFDLLEPEELNSEFKKAMAIAPVPLQEFWHLRDLILIRHTIAHHAAVIRHIDLPRFSHFIVKPGCVINPPIDFVRSELTYLFNIGRTIEMAVRSAAFEKFIATAGKGWSKQPPKDVVELIELFGYFGYIESTDVAVSYSDPGSDLRRRQEAEAKLIRNSLIQRCIADLANEYGD